MKHSRSISSKANPVSHEELGTDWGATVKYLRDRGLMHMTFGFDGFLCQGQSAKFNLET